MSELSKPKVLIVGAGSMGLIAGYHLSLSGASITFLVRPHRVEALSRPQILYSYEQNSLKEFTGYRIITSPSEIASTAYDYIVITLDAVALKNEVGQSLVKAIGEATRGTDTKILLGSISFNLLSWFLETSGLDASQATNGLLGTHAYSPKAVTLPIHAPTDPELLAKADLAYTDAIGQGFMLDDSSPTVAAAFMELYNKSGVSKCITIPAADLAVAANPIFAIFAACYLLDWPSFASIDAEGEVWKLATKAVKEIQGLSVHGMAGQKALLTTTEEGLAANLIGFEKVMLPLDLPAFNKYHHGGKVNAQDRELLRACVEYGEKEGHEMLGLKELIRRVEAKDVAVK